MGQLIRPIVIPARPAPERSAKQLAHLDAIHKAQYNTAVNKYRQRLAGRGWLQTKQVERLTGSCVTGANTFLRKLLAAGHIERRPTGGTDRYFKNKGWDWRWIEGK